MKKINRRIKRDTSRNRGPVLDSKTGGGFGVIFIGLGATFLAFIILINIADYSLFTYKRNLVSKAMDYAVNAAVQEVDLNESSAGLAEGFYENTGNKRMDGIKINMAKARKIFLSTFYQNCNLTEYKIDSDLLLCTTYAFNKKLNYTITAGDEQIGLGSIESPELLENKINQAISSYWIASEENSRVYINGNPKTNMIEKGTYLFAFIKDINIKGIYSKRSICLSSFAGAKADRADSNRY
ncbi:hypothetical protein LY28_00964 [Ruminiclostridium sufflavum DSM 19573]|uniref:Flp pilus-assembly TadE/G-like protein n=1 Tax=Ruminiclostridium sufflavum DSM 19573 TaxID=1121337 RepID=A0A318XSC3_9FIRM|nr:hypothetical protein LY28_00964 [Ruminiclostridium sufflavum DSM 19573]